MNIAFIHEQIISSENANFFATIPLRTSRMLKGKAKIYFFYTGNFNYELNEQGVMTEKIKNNSENTICYLLKPFLLINEVRSLCIKHNIDVLMNLMNHYYFFVPCLGAKLAGSATIARVSGKLPRDNKTSSIKMIRRRVGDFFEMISLGKSDSILALSESLRKKLLDNGVKPNKIRVVSQGVDLEHFTFRPIENVRKQPQEIVYIGRLIKNKNVEMAIQAVTSLNRIKKLKLRLNICGFGPLEENLKKQYGHNKDVNFLGHKEYSEIPQILRSSDILILPSRSEGLPNVILEAMATGVPVVATAVGEVPSLLAEGRGLIVPSDDQKYMEDALYTIITDEKLRIRCVKASREYVEKYHGFEVVSNQFMKLAHEAISQRKK